MKAGLQCSLFPGKPQLIMKSHCEKLLIIPLIGVMTGCTAIGESMGSIQAGYDNAIRQGRMDQQAQNIKPHSDSILASSKNLCEIRNSDTPEDYRQPAIDACTKYVYTASMNNIRAKMESSKYNSINAGSPTHSVRNSVQFAPPVSTPEYGQKVYRADECVGAVVNGQCHGSIIPKGYAPTCYGTMLNGQCTGPMF